MVFATSRKAGSLLKYCSLFPVNSACRQEDSITADASSVVPLTMANVMG
jgi:hypothetical protein